MITQYTFHNAPDWFQKHHENLPYYEAVLIFLQKSFTQYADFYDIASTPLDEKDPLTLKLLTAYIYHWKTAILEKTRDNPLADLILADALTKNHNNAAKYCESKLFPRLARNLPQQEREDFQQELFVKKVFEKYDGKYSLISFLHLKIKNFRIDRFRKRNEIDDCIIKDNDGNKTTQTEIQLDKNPLPDEVIGYYETLKKSLDVLNENEKEILNCCIMQDKLDYGDLAILRGCSIDKARRDVIDVLQKFGKALCNIYQRRFPDSGLAKKEKIEQVLEIFRKFYKEIPF
jgi:DNA-directed RNA polymerase specialized sigma24 family protein